MKLNPKRTEERLLRVLNAWETLTPGKTFGGLTLEQYRDIIAPTQTARGELDDLEATTIKAIKVRDAADLTARAKTRLVVNSVLGDPTEGADSAL